MKFEVGKHYKTSIGKVVRCLATDKKSTYQNVFLGDDGHLFSVDGNGRLFSEESSDCDIVSEWRELVRASGWVNVYPRAALVFHTSREAADEVAASDRITCIYVEGVEGKEPE